MVLLASKVRIKLLTKYRLKADFAYLEAEYDMITQGLCQSPSFHSENDCFMQKNSAKNSEKNLSVPTIV
jgi:hypothetical protein